MSYISENHDVIANEELFGGSEEKALMELGRSIAAASDGNLLSPSGELVNDDNRKQSHAFWMKLRGVLRKNSPESKTFKVGYGIYPGGRLGDLIVKTEDGEAINVRPDEFDEDTMEQIDTVGVCQEGSSWKVSKEWWTESREIFGDKAGGAWLYEAAAPTGRGRGSKPEGVRFKIN